MIIPIIPGFHWGFCPAGFVVETPKLGVCTDAEISFGVCVRVPKLGVCTMGMESNNHYDSQYKI